MNTLAYTLPTSCGTGFPRGGASGVNYVWPNANERLQAWIPNIAVYYFHTHAHLFYLDIILEGIWYCFLSTDMCYQKFVYKRTGTHVTVPFLALGSLICLIRLRFWSVLTNHLPIGLFACFTASFNVSINCGQDQYLDKVRLRKYYHPTRR